MLTKSQLLQVRDRWKTIAKIDLRSSLNLAPMGHPFPLTIAKLMDYRGILIVESLHGQEINAVDLSGCTLGKGQFSSTVRDSLLEDASLEGNIGTFFEKCSFARSDLQFAVLRGAFHECVFNGAILTSARSSNANFVKCNFDKARMNKSSFFDCRFSHCTFLESKFGSGSLAGCVFTSCTFKNVNFDKVVLTRTKGLELP